MGAPEMLTCCGFSLKHGTIIIGVVQSIFAFMCLILSAAYEEHPRELIELADPSIIPKIQSLKLILTVIAVASALQVVTSILLIFAAETNRPSLLMPWLILNPIALIVYFVALLIVFIHHGGDNSTPFIFIHILSSCVISLIVVHNILTVYSFRQHLRRLNF